MSAWTLVRNEARAFHRAVWSDDALVPSDALIDAATRASGVSIFKRPPGDALLDGGEACYDAEGLRIFVSDALETDQWAFHVAHEFGHHRLHRHTMSCEGDAIDVATAAHPNASLLGAEDDYSPKERKEAQANLFAREFLLPSDKLQALALTRRSNAASLAADLKLPVALVHHQMADTFLLPPETRASTPNSPPPPLDDSQREAVNATDGPVLVRAGPGTGKTRTLIGRIGHLIRSDVPPNQILALTFSNDSAADLSARVRAEFPDQAASVWTGTFHAFGLELLRKFGTRVGLPIDVRVLDRPSALFHLESLLGELDLDYYLDLREPMRGLKNVLNAIGRAKDELCGPGQYQALVDSMVKRGADPDVCTRAGEVARVYRIYDASCRSAGVIDFGDLIARSVELLDAHAEVRELVRDSYPHMLVDEYQDMNAASRRLLALLVRDGKGPWVVGDVRQSIYRFRGASPLNITRFDQDFPGASITDLAVNYRSYDEIIASFHAFGMAMSCASVASPLRLSAHRGDGGLVSYAVADTREAEAQGIAAAIERDIQGGGRAAAHAVLGRSHTTLVHIAEHLERCGIPCMYFGNFFERPEIRDLLCVLSVAADFDGLGLLRMASGEPFRVSRADVLLLFDRRKERNIPMLKLLGTPSEWNGVSEQGRAGLTALASVFEDTTYATQPADLLLRYLFDFGAVWRGPLGEAGVRGQQHRLAAYQLLELALGLRFHARHGDPKRMFLAHIRTLEVLDEEKELRKPPAIAARLDAVQVMTVHASKGLEFPVVHVPSLSPSYFPAAGRAQPCPAPDGLIAVDPIMTPKAEEEGLFFVALSRAREQLHLSRAERYGGAPRPNPSPLLEPLTARLGKPASWTAQGPQPQTWSALPAPAASERFAVGALETYLECPRRYYYQDVLGLRASGSKQAHLQMMSSVRASFEHLREHVAGQDDETNAKIEATWRALGPVDHPLASAFRAHADRMLAHARASMAGIALPIERTLVLGGIHFDARADHIVETKRGVSVQRLKMGRLNKDKETMRAKYSVLHAAVKADLKQPIVFEHVSLLTGDRRVETPSAKDADKIHGQLQNAINDIARGQFAPKRNDRHCPTCPFFFLCPAEGLI